jgi:hypothetical protein
LKKTTTLMTLLPICGMVHPVVKERELFVVSLIASLPSQGQVCPQMWSE